MAKPDDIALAKGLKELLNPSKLDDFIACALPHNDPCQGTGPSTALLHVRFKEDEPEVAALAEFLWGQCMYYALPRRRRLKFQEALESDFSIVARIHQAVRDIFISFNAQYPARASELGEVLAYCVVQHHLVAPQVAAKMALKTSSNMPIHGLDGVHAAFEDGALTIYFLESKLSGSANDGVKDYAQSAGNFLTNRNQYLREYEIVSDLGNLDSLEGEAKESALEYFDIFENPRLPRRERYIGVICYSETKHFANKIPIGSGKVGAHEDHFKKNYYGEHKHHQDASRKHIEAKGSNSAKNILFFVAVPNVNILREQFYQSTGLPSARAETKKRSKTTAAKA